ncbi:recombinase family protein [Hymenobacter rubripertinctus]|uniref:Recombinase family protein n=1 Tax=Hymenobacter rubripertinctus TaxID=2029981 RepID=A0A418QKW8_9BACT|nr:recombinase family protein [Hymenobacter rubripertinctus]RIY05805.1 recombinase family protein [Hymenobacter rubripertinctus]
MKIGYARVSTRDQNLELQLDALTQAGCGTIFQEKVSGATTARPELDKLLASLRQGDTVYIYKLDRLGRSLKHLLDMVAELEFKGVGLVSLTDAINTASAQGRLVFNLFASLAEFERELIRERTYAGLAAARARGRVGGRPRGLSEEAQRTAMVAETLYKEQQLGVNEIAQRLRISKVTLYKYLRHRGVVIHAYRKGPASQAAE